MAIILFEGGMDLKLIVIPGQPDLSHLLQLDGRSLLFVAAIVFVVRPLSIGLLTRRHKE